MHLGLGYQVGRECFTRPSTLCLELRSKSSVDIFLVSHTEAICCIFIIPKYFCITMIRKGETRLGLLALSLRV